MVANRMNVLVPVSMKQCGLALLETRPDLRVTRYDPAIAPADLHALLPDTVAIALAWTRFGQAALDHAPLLQVAARIGVGYDAVDVPAMTARRIPVMLVGSANARAVAEHALFLILALAKRGAEMHRRVRTGEGHDRSYGLPMELAGRTVLIVGFGRIGTRLAPRCAALEMNVLVHDPYVPDDTIRAAGWAPVPDLNEGLATADFVSIHCPKNAETIGLFDQARLAAMKPGSCLVNTARGGIVDEPALVAALASGHLAGAGLDVFDPEPPDPANPLLGFEQVIASPHMAGITTEAMDAMSLVTAQNILSVLDGTPQRDHAINPEVFDLPR